MPPAGPSARRGLALALALVALLSALLAAASVGSVGIPFGAVGRVLWAGLLGTRGTVDPAQAAIVLSIRLPRVALALVVGAVLGAVGAAYQGLFRNPLADPYLVGVSSGASLGAALAIALTWRLPWSEVGAVPTAAFGFALLATVLAYGVSRIGGRTSITLLILAGVALGSLFSAGTTLLMLSARDAFRSVEILSWIMGSLSRATWRQVEEIAPFAAGGLALVLACSYKLNVLQLGDDQAAALGLGVERLRLVLILGGSLATAAGVSASGIVGFVGLVVPHAVRLVWGPDHRFLIPMSGLLGGIFLILADLVARTLLAPREIPLGVVTACVGVPLFVALLLRQKRNLV